MNRGNFALEHQGEVSRESFGKSDLPHLSVDITHDTRMPYGKLKVMPAVAHNYGMGKSFTKKELTKIILDKNEVIADLEKNAYGEGFWDDVRAGLVKHNERKKTTPISEDDWKKQMEDYEKPTENWGADELDGGGAAPAAKPETPSAVAAAAAALQPVRTAIQNGIGDAIYGKSDDPKKQKKGLLGISEEGKEESKKKVMKNIVAPLAKTAMGLKKSMTDTWNLMFNQDQYNADMKAGLIKRIKKEEAEMGIVRDKTDPKLIVRKPRGLYKTETTDPEVESYKPIAHRDDSAKAKEFMIRVPNPLFGIVKPTSKTLAEAGIKLWAGVNSFKDDDIDYSLRALQNDKFMWIPEDRAKELYPKLRQFAADEQDKGLAEGFEDFGWTKGEMKQFAKIDPRTLTGIDLIDWRTAKLLQDKQVTKNALEKVTKDIAEEEKGKTIIRGERPVRIEPDQARLTKMREAKVRVEKRMADLEERGRQDFKDMMMFAEADKAKRDQEYYAKQSADAMAKQTEDQAEEAEFAALPAEERIAILETYKADLRKQGAPEWQIEEFDEQIRSIEAESKDEEETRQAEGSVELLQQAEVVGGDDGEMEGGGMVEFALAKSGRMIYNPDGDMTKAGRQTFTPDWDAYGEDVASGKKNAFNLSRSMYIQNKATELPGFKMVKDDTSIRFYRKDDENVMLVGIRGTDVHSWTDLYTWAVIGRGIGEDLRFTTRYQEDLAKLVRFQRNYPPSQFYYVATGSSLAGSIADRFLELGIIEEAVTYNPSIEKKFILEENLLNHRIYLDTDPLFILMGQYAPNTEIRKNASRVDYYNPIKEKDQLVKSHSIYPLYNFAFEGGGMEGGGKTYTIEEWKAHFDAKLEQKRQQIEAREAKKKQTAKAKRARAKERRDGRDEPPPLEEAQFRTSRVMKAAPPKEPEPEPESAEQPPPPDPPAPPAPKKRKPRFKIVAPASARVELREELVAEQPRSPAGEFAKPAEVAVMAVDQAPQRAYMKLMKSPIFTEAERKLLTRIRETKMTPVMKAKLLARSGLARKVMEMLGLDESVFQGQRARARIADKVEKRVATKKATEILFPHLPEEIKTGLQKLAQDIMNMKGRRPTMLDDARRTDTLKKMTETEKREMLRRNFVAGVKSCEAVVSMTRTDMFGDYSCRRWEAGEPSYFKQVEKSDYGVKKKCMAIGDDAGMPQGATLDQLKPVVGVGRDGAMMSSRMLCELSPSTWGVEDKPDAKFLYKGVPITKSTPDADLAEHVRQTQRVWRLCIWEMLDICGIKTTIQKELTGTWKRGYGIIINWKTLQTDDKNLTKVKVREAQEEVNEKLSSPKLRDFLVDLRGFCEMTAEGVEAEDDGDVARRRKDEEERIYMMRLESEITPDEEEERAKVRANPELKAKLWEAIKRETGRLNSVFDTAPFSGDLRQRINRMKRIAGIDYNTGYGSVVPANFWVSGLKAKLPPIRKKEGYYPSVEQYIRDIEKR